MEMSKKINVFLCDDHLIMINGLKELINSDKRLIVSGFAQSINEFKEIITENSLKIDVLLLDIKIQEQCGIELAKWLKAQQHSIAILFLTMYDDLQSIKNAIEVGCHGYLPKNIDAEELKIAIKTVANGMIYFPPSIFKIIANNSEVVNTTFDSKKPEAKIYLSTRESEVLELILSGKNTNEIGAALFLSIHTVNTYRKSLFKKFHVQNVVSLVVKAMKEYY